MMTREQRERLEGEARMARRDGLPMLAQAIEAALAELDARQWQPIATAPASAVTEAAERLRRIQGGESLKAVYHDPRFPQATNYRMAFDEDRAEVADAYLALTRDAQQGEDELFRLAFIYAELDRESFVEAHRNMPTDPAAVQATKLLEQLRAYRLRRWGKTRLEAMLETAETITLAEAIKRATPAPEREGA